jgi:hypothetical protein
MSQALMRAPQPLALNTLDEMLSLGQVFAASGMFADIKDQAGAVVKIMAGQELGLPPFVAMTGIHLVKGRPTLSADLLAKKVKASGKYDYRVRQHTDQICEIEFFENGQSLGISPFTLSDAKKAGTQNLDKFPRNMLFARAMSNGVRWFCPDVTTMTVYVEGEIVEEVIEVQSEPALIAPVAESQPEIKYASAETVAAVCQLWPKYGTRRNGMLIPFERILAEHKWTLDTWPFDRAQATLASLQEKALETETAEAVEGEVI